MALRGIRGAASVAENSKEEIWRTAQKLVTKIMSLNSIVTEDVGAMIFSSTKDLTAAFPTTGIRQLPPFKLVPLFDVQETEVDGSLPMCIRVLILAETEKSPRAICHVYLGEARKLRPDIAGN